MAKSVQSGDKSGRRDGLGNVIVGANLVFASQEFGGNYSPSGLREYRSLMRRPCYR